MRRAWVLIIVSLVFLLSFNLLFTKVYAATDDTIASASSQQVNYELPYPGLLPDSPLYILRAIRDRIVGFFISDPLKKSEFNLLQADKRLNAGIYLVNKGKVSLALSTISKAENYFDEALGKMEEAKKQKENAGEIKGRMKNALKKHEQELGILIKRINTDYQGGFEIQLKRVLSFEKRLSR